MFKDTLMYNGLGPKVILAPLGPPGQEASAQPLI